MHSLTAIRAGSFAPASPRKIAIRVAFVFNDISRILSEAR
jgi:hypothetical protein